jgi:hypothetical protein
MLPEICYPKDTNDITYVDILLKIIMKSVFSVLAVKETFYEEASVICFNA